MLGIRNLNVQKPLRGLAPREMSLDNTSYLLPAGLTSSDEEVADGTKRVCLNVLLQVLLSQVFTRKGDDQRERFLFLSGTWLQYFDIQIAATKACMLEPIKGKG